MKGLLPDSLINDLLKDSGVYGGRSRLIRTVGKYKSFTVTRKKSDLDLKFVEKLVTDFTASLDADWRVFYLKEAQLSRADVSIMPLKKCRAVKEGICCAFALGDLAAPLLLYFAPETLYLILAKYFGSGEVMGGKRAKVMTEIENDFLVKMLEGIRDCLVKSFGAIFPVEMKLLKSNCTAEDQRDSLRNESAVVDYHLKVAEENFAFSLCVPPSFLEAIQMSLSGQGSAQEKQSDPLWQETLAHVVARSDVKIEISLGQIKIPFASSLKLQVGDVFPWERAGQPPAELAFLGSKRMTGVIGTVGGNYAVQIEKVL